MKSSDLIRWSGLAATIAGNLFIAMNLTALADDVATNGSLQETAPEKETVAEKESTEGEAVPPVLSPDEKPDLPSAPVEQTGRH